MGLTIFQRLVLYALYLLVWHSGERKFAGVLWTIAHGHHTDSQQDSVLKMWVQFEEHDKPRKGVVIQDD